MNDSFPKLATPWALTRSTRDSGCDPELFEAWEGRTVPTPWPAAYGGDLSVGALSAVVRSASETQLPHSLQLAFLLPGDRDGRMTYVVEHVRDGFRYANRSLRVMQDGKQIASGTASLRSPRAGEEPFSPKLDLTAVAQPETLPTAEEAIAQLRPRSNAEGGVSKADAASAALDAYWSEGRALDTRHVDPPLYGETVEPRTVNRLWVRFAGREDAQRALIETPHGRAALIAYLADDTILEAAAASLGCGWLAPGLFSTTVQQNLWFHADFDASGWLFFSQRLVSRSGDHAVCQGEIYTREGELVATVLQEGIVRVRPVAD